ncbi:HAD family hydrolase, partial [Escherichia coli]|uniref:HAD family hydrolase n=1 Tax=Escherichia coli TaxID=562 RepID=UPI001BD004CB
MSKLKAILFDYDGTLRDTRSLIYASFDFAFDAHDKPVPTKDELAPYIHHHSFVHEALMPEVPYEDFEREYR